MFRDSNQKSWVSSHRIAVFAPIALPCLLQTHLVTYSYYCSTMAPSNPSKGGEYGSLPVSEPPSQTPSTAASVDLARPSLKNALIAELFGTAILVQVGCGGLCVALYLGNMSGMFQIGAVFAMGATMAIYATAAISGGHLNPAVTLAFYLVRRDDFPFRNVLPYWCAQLLGGILAGAINLWLFHVSIRRYEKKHGLERGSAESIESAAAFGDYWRYVVVKSVYVVWY